MSVANLPSSTFTSPAPAAARPATPGHPLYVWHVPKTAGCALTLCLEESFPVGALTRASLMDGWTIPEDWRNLQIVSGHLGSFFPAVWRHPFSSVVVLREPAARAWSQWNHWRRLPAPVAVRFGVVLPPTFAGLADQPRNRSAVEEHQATWLTGCPTPSTLDPIVSLQGQTFHYPPAPLTGDALRRAAIAALDRIDIVGVTERLDETIDVLGRYLGRRLHPARRVNHRPDDDAGPKVIPEPDAALVRRLSPIDIELHRIANERLDAALALLPEVPEPVVDTPWELTMDQGLCGTGWHQRVQTPEVGWHRWTGPERRSTVRPEVRFDGPVQVEVEIVSAVSDDLVRSLRLDVQGTPVRHELQPGHPGVIACARTVLRASRPVEIGITVERTAVHAHAAEEGHEPTALAVRAIRITPDREPLAAGHVVPGMRSRSTS